jgi:LETM1 and EF-hand domain-containing protein 1
MISLVTHYSSMSVHQTLLLSAASIPLSAQTTLLFRRKFTQCAYNDSIPRHSLIKRSFLPSASHSSRLSLQQFNRSHNFSLIRPFSLDAHNSSSSSGTSSVHPSSWPSYSKHPAPLPAIPVILKAPEPSRAQKLWLIAKKEAHHYWLGTKLLWADIKLAATLCSAVLKGHELTRRERKQLLRTSADLLRLIPFAVILIVPFMEFTLPFLLKIFPNMLPSTYVDSAGQEVKLQKQLAAKIQMANFLQETTALMAAQLAAKEKDSKSGEKEKNSANIAHSFKLFMEKVRRGESVKNEEIVEFSSLFDDEFTLENLNRSQLAAMCKLLDVKDFGSDWVLRYKITRKLRDLKEDDKWIAKEGVNQLNEEELKEACRARGIHPGQTLVYMRRKLNDWLELSLKFNIPHSLLVLSRAFSSRLAGVVPQDLADSLRYMPDNVISDTEENITNLSTDAKEKLELLEKEKTAKEQQLLKEKKRSRQLKLDKSAQGGENQQKIAATVGLADTKEKLEKLEDENEDLAEDIDEIEAKQAQKKSQKRLESEELTALPASTSPTEPTEIDVATKQSKPVEKAPAKHADEDEEDLEESESNSKSTEKELKKVDRLNEQLGSLLDALQAELEKADKVAANLPKKTEKKLKKFLEQNFANQEEETAKKQR